MPGPSDFSQKMHKLIPIVTSPTKRKSKPFQFFQNLNYKTFRFLIGFDQFFTSIGRKVMTGQSYCSLCELWSLKVNEFHDTTGKNQENFNTLNLFQTSSFKLELYPNFLDTGPKSWSYQRPQARLYCALKITSITSDMLVDCNLFCLFGNMLHNSCNIWFHTSHCNTLIASTI